QRWVDTSTTKRHSIGACPEGLEAILLQHIPRRHPNGGQRNQQYSMRIPAPPDQTQTKQSCLRHSASMLNDEHMPQTTSH
ncbi:hypothetical protein L2449_32455, partial [Mesorhizobium muleiense]|uniref:hypothetical protein n=1 Tax=Mesorhizobium muleiense TaxID=1004279 RepID=UPI001F21DBE7